MAAKKTGISDSQAKNFRRKLARRVYAVRRYYSNEPERSRRVLRLAFANWLAFVEHEHEANRKPAVRVTLQSGKRNATTFFYPVSRDCAGCRTQGDA